MSDLDLPDSWHGWEMEAKIAYLKSEYEAGELREFIDSVSGIDVEMTESHRPFWFTKSSLASVTAAYLNTAKKPMMPTTGEIIERQLRELDENETYTPSEIAEHLGLNIELDSSCKNSDESVDSGKV